MTAATHRLGGLVSGMILVASVQTNNEWLIVLGAVLGSLIPDIDNKNSAISRRWRVTRDYQTVVQPVPAQAEKLYPKYDWAQRDYSFADTGDSYTTIGSRYKRGVREYIYRHISGISAIGRNYKPHTI